MDASSDVTLLLRQMPTDRDAAFEALLPVVYSELRRIAQAQVRRGPASDTLNATALAHEAYLRLADQTSPRWEDRVHFFSVAAKAMRHVVIDYARGQHAQKRGGKQPSVTMEEGMAGIDPWQRAHELLALDDALDRLADLDPRLAQIVECRFFGEMSQEDVAQALDRSSRTIRRDERKAMALLRELMES